MLILIVIMLVPVVVAGVIVLFFISAFLAAYVDYLRGGGKAGTTTGCNEDDFATQEK